MSSTKRESLEIFDYLGRFGIGHETTNRIDNILIFGSQDDTLRKYFDLLIESDTFYGNTERFRAAQREYIETPEATTDDRHVFVEMLTEQRRGLFFKIPDELAGELRLWDLSVFTGAGEYLAEVAEPLSERGARLPPDHRTPCEGAQPYLHRHAGGDGTRTPVGDQSLLLWCADQ